MFYVFRYFIFTQYGRVIQYTSHYEHRCNVVYHCINYQHYYQPKFICFHFLSQINHVILMQIAECTLLLLKNVFLPHMLFIFDQSCKVLICFCNEQMMLNMECNLLLKHLMWQRFILPDQILTYSPQNLIRRTWILYTATCNGPALSAMGAKLWSIRYAAHYVWYLTCQIVKKHPFYMDFWSWMIPPSQ